MSDDPLTEVRIGDTVLVAEPGQVLVFDAGGDETTEVGAITAAGLQDAATIDDEILSYIGGAVRVAERDTTEDADGQNA